jgi:leucine dehydrogenase
MLKIKEIYVDGYQKVIEALDPSTNLHCFVALHNCKLGPALGGTRIYPYASSEEALNDVLRLSKAMTYKSAIVENGLGGGKGVIIANPKKDKNDALLLSFADVINSLEGTYIAAEDVGTTTDDMMVLKRKTPYVCALPTEKSSGDPSRFTAWGVFQGMRAVAEKLWRTTSLAKKVIAIQGLGNVGSKLANILFWEGAELIFCDIDPSHVHKTCILYGAKAVSAEDFWSVKCDILAPCALGGIINESTIPKLQCKAIAGSANNQLLTPENGIHLMKKNILYAPDYIINSGGISNAAAEFDPDGYNPVYVRDKVNQIYDLLLEIFNRSQRERKPANQIADEIAEYNIQHEVGKRRIPIIFKGQWGQAGHPDI